MRAQVLTAFDGPAEFVLTPVVDRVAPLEELPREMERMEARQTVGRVVVAP